jgi:septum formation protein
MNEPRVILASASPRRRELLTLIGVAHEVRPADIDESHRPGELPAAHAERLAREKACAIVAADAVTIGSDTIVVVDGDILGKPRDAAQASEMLRRLSGRSHIVMTGVAVRWRERIVSAVEQVDVTFRALSAKEIARYIETGEPMDKAGAYGIQGLASRFIDRIDGSYSNVVGLPVALVWRRLRSISARS